MEKAPNQTRTDDPFITSEVLYQLSYRSNEFIISNVLSFGNGFFLFLYSGRRDVPFAAWSVPIGIQADAEQAAHTGYWEETVAEQGVSFCEIFLPVIKNVFAKFDKRLG